MQDTEIVVVRQGNALHCVKVAISAADHDTAAVGCDNVTREYFGPVCRSHGMGSKDGDGRYRSRLTEMVLGWTFMHALAC